MIDYLVEPFSFTPPRTSKISKINGKMVRIGIAIKVGKSYTALLVLTYFQYYFVLKFVCSEKVTKFCEISTVDLTGTTSTMEITQNFEASQNI